ncbi:MAG: hypothetical protein U9Q70_07715 [Chloroflexota bacterium]|nr:hypothetical protein [Chloroflexota bacterium]
MSEEPSNPRANRKRAERLTLLAVVVILIVGGALTIGLVYGWPEALTALLCLIPGAATIVLLWGLLNLVEKLTREDR